MAWMILSTASELSATTPGYFSYSVGYAHHHPPRVSVPLLEEALGAAQGYADPSLETIAPNFWVSLYPPHKNDIPREMRRRIVVHNFGSQGERTTVLLDYPDGFLDDGRKIGVVAFPNNGDHFLLASLRVAITEPNDADADAAGNNITRRIDYYNSFLATWHTVEQAGLQSDLAWRWDDVVSHDGCLWWIDNSRGLFRWNPFNAAEDPLHIITLPDEEEAQQELPGGGGPGDAYVRRYVQLSAGSFRYVKVRKPRQPDMSMFGPAGGASSLIAGVIAHAAHRAAATLAVSVRTLADPLALQWPWEWEDDGLDHDPLEGQWGQDLDHDFNFAEIWDWYSYKTHGLPEKDPVFALMHPLHNDVLFFFLEDYLFGVDMTLGMITGSQLHGLGSHPTSASVRAWMLPAADADAWYGINGRIYSIDHIGRLALFDR